MNSKKHLYQRLTMASSIMVAAVLILSACSLLSLAATATLDAAAVKGTADAVVAQALQTLSVVQTNTAAALPVSTSTIAATQQPAATSTTAATSTMAPIPTNTLVPATPTKTLVPATPKPTITATPAAYSCTLVSTSPVAGTKINISTDFDAIWVVKNTGTKTWDIGNFDLKYVSGTKMQTKADVFDVTTAVAPGAELKLIVDMKTPSTAGTYTASWMLTMNGTTAFCTLPVSIVAIKP